MKLGSWLFHRRSSGICMPEMEAGDAASILSDELLDGAPVSYSCNGKQALAEAVCSVVTKYRARGFLNRLGRAWRILVGRSRPEDLQDLVILASDSRMSDDGEPFYVVNMGDGRMDVTRSRRRGKDGHPLTRRLLYQQAGRMCVAESEYAHQFMCGGFPYKHDSDTGRPTKDEWLDSVPFDYEVDTFMTEKLFPDQY